METLIVQKTAQKFESPKLGTSTVGYYHEIRLRSKLESREHSETGFSGRETRRHRRFNLEVEIKIDSKTSGVLTGRTVDISESGISAMLKIEVPVGEMVELQFSLPNGQVTVYALVRHRNAFRYGFQFVETPASREIILAACESLAGPAPSRSPA
jgi:hypothetical protein